MAARVSGSTQRASIFLTSSLANLCGLKFAFTSTIGGERGLLRSTIRSRSTAAVRKQGETVACSSELQNSSRGVGLVRRYCRLRMLCNEGWLLRRVLDWFDRDRTLSHKLSFLPEALWYAEALLPSRFRPQRRSDEGAESFTHADGVVGHFEIAPGERGEARLLHQAKQFVVTEAKLGSSLSARTKNAPG